MIEQNPNLDAAVAKYFGEHATHTQEETDFFKTKEKELKIELENALVPIIHTGYLHRDELPKIMAAFDLSASAHRHIKRRLGSIYLTHPTNTNIRKAERLMSLIEDGKIKTPVNHLFFSVMQLHDVPEYLAKGNDFGLIFTSQEAVDLTALAYQELTGITDKEILRMGKRLNAVTKKPEQNYLEFVRDIGNLDLYDPKTEIILEKGILGRAKFIGAVAKKRAERALDFIGSQQKYNFYEAEETLIDKICDREGNTNDVIEGPNNINQEINRLPILWRTIVGPYRNFCMHHAVSEYLTGNLKNGIKPSPLRPFLIYSLHAMDLATISETKDLRAEQNARLKEEFSPAKITRLKLAFAAVEAEMRLYEQTSDFMRVTNVNDESIFDGTFSYFEALSQSSYGVTPEMISRQTPLGISYTQIDDGLGRSEEGLESLIRKTMEKYGVRIEKEDIPLIRLNAALTLFKTISVYQMQKKYFARGLKSISSVR